MDTRGSSLVEVVIAMLLLAVGAGAVMGALLQAGHQLKATQGADAGGQYAVNLLESLKAYVTADASARTLSAAPGGSWHLPGDDCPGQAAGCWALSSGRHTAPAFPPNGRLEYEVSDGPGGTKRVAVTASWQAGAP